LGKEYLTAAKLKTPVFLTKSTEHVHTQNTGNLVWCRAGICHDTWMMNCGYFQHFKQFYQ